MRCFVAGSGGPGWPVVARGGLWFLRRVVSVQGRWAGTGNGGLIVDLGAGKYRVSRSEIAAPWDDEQSVVAMYFVREP